jgi:hypothetical protein
VVTTRTIKDIAAKVNCKGAEMLEADNQKKQVKPIISGEIDQKLDSTARSKL